MWIFVSDHVFVEGDQFFYRLRNRAGIIDMQLRAIPSLRERMMGKKI